MLARLIACAVLAGGCGFHPTETAGDGPAPTGDAHVDARGVDTTMAGGEGSVRDCLLTGDPTLRLCLDFEGALPSDGSPSPNTVNSTGVASTTRATPGGGSEGAARVDTGSQIQIPETASLDITPQITLAAWINPDRLPTAGESRFGILDNDGQYSMFLHADGTVTCNVNAGAVTQPISPNVWTHVGCVADGSKLFIYRDGSEDQHVNNTAAIMTTSTSGTRIGQDDLGGGAGQQNFIGQLDDVRIWARALPKDELCQSGGFSSC